MSLISVALPFSTLPHFESTLRQFIESPLVERIFVVHGGEYSGVHRKCEGVVSPTLASGKTLNSILGKVPSGYFLFVSQSQEFQLGQAALERFTSIAEQTSAGMCFSDFHDVKKGVRSEHPVIDYQFGSIRFLLSVLSQMSREPDSTTCGSRFPYPIHYFTFKNISTQKWNLICA